MNVPTPDDVFEAVRDRLAADPGFAAACPGDVWYGRRPPKPAGAYAVGTVEQRPAHYSDTAGGYLQRFIVELSVWCESTESAAAATGPARQALDTCLGWTPTDPTNGVSVPNAVATVHVRPAGGSLKLSPELRKGQDVLAAGCRVEVLVQGQR